MVSVLASRYRQHTWLPPKEPSTETPRRFVHLADQLQTRKIIEDEELRSSLQIKGKLNQPVAMNYHQPDEENLRSYLLDFRKFTMEGEPVFMNWVFGVAYRHITGEDLVQYLTQARQQWKKSMTRGDIAFLVDGQALQPERVLDLWINGFYFHEDREKARKLRALSNVPLSRWLFINVLVRATQLLLYSAHIIKIARGMGWSQRTPFGDGCRASRPVGQALQVAPGSRARNNDGQLSVSNLAGLRSTCHTG